MPQSFPLYGSPLAQLSHCIVYILLGPLTTNDTDGMTILIGVASWGWGCGRPQSPGVYAKVSSVLPWIDEYMKAGDKCMLPAGSNTISTYLTSNTHSTYFKSNTPSTYLSKISVVLHLNILASHYIFCWRISMYPFNNFIAIQTAMSAKIRKYQKTTPLQIA